MRISSEARAARKEAQLARLDEKENNLEGYPEFYANQPLQQARAEMNERIAEARRVLRQARKDFEVAQATGIDLEEAEAKFRSAASAITGLQTLKKARFKPTSSLNLSAGGEA
jgi:hypothetical protein